MYTTGMQCCFTSWSSTAVSLPQDAVHEDPAETVVVLLRPNKERAKRAREVRCGNLLRLDRTAVGYSPAD